ncbi:response regulator [Jonesia denitrificans]|uniref:Two component transcriptional regulator, LuxR family n=1 Tax=Jonesia denitrificans (strain ATCC 14870 / DSM 20603 / BCRC 15368 / CIP 55.134 / JCM 11481 / NBRC 15587 / NCTC 10816 / Prevot 55134) TaxID=471856 RepID=C7R5H7_JONDD|nr:response regulator transcription factor [Jonesia denitrificans]ACV09250.1 two component transcriptional regulator, LuxR family [Jonesia denitrificans DSM 20603]ASE09481.1 DNA-binding response regulator [Jonesia denitrificans]QXB44028.1 response regulator transcription factor [Jonesia denitrificans]SQH21487.1 Transcriptional regulatory protein devR (dosR) [Jonesia denitrificans]
MTTEAHNTPIRVMIVDDDALVRTLLTQILTMSDMHVVAEAHDGDQVIGMVHAHHPAVILMDLRMARMSGIESITQVTALTNPPGVIAMTSFDTESAILDAIDAGARGFVAKDSGPQELATAVRNVAAGEGALSRRAARVVVERLRAAETRPAQQFAQSLLASLTDREREITALVAEGFSTAEIATRLYLGEATVKTHLKSAMNKTGTDNRTRLAVLAAKAGLADGH